MANRTQLTTISTAATRAPIVLWADQNSDQGNLYLAVNHTFLDFYTEEKKTIKRFAYGRSASADSHLTRSSQSFVPLPLKCAENKQVTPTSKVRSFSPSTRSTLSSDNETFRCAGSRRCSDNEVNSWADLSDLQSPDATPRYNYGQQSCYSSGTAVTSWTESDLQMLDITPRNNYYVQQDVSDLQSSDASPRNDKACDKEVTPWAGLQTPETTPRGHNYRHPHPAAAVSWDVDCEAKNPKTVKPVMIPQSPCVNFQRSKTKKPINNERKLNQAFEQDLTKLSKDVPSPLAQQQPQTADAPTLTISLASALNSCGGRPQTTAPPTQSPSSPHHSSNDFFCNQMQPKVVKAQDTKTETASQKKNAKKQEPKKQKPAAAASKGVTTLMIRGIPCGFSQEALLALFDDVGLKGKYNFFYLPIDAKKNANLGYAFINFVDPESADLCTNTLKGVRLAPSRSAKTCNVAPAVIQGLAKLSEHFRNTAVSAGGRGPMFLM